MSSVILLPAIWLIILIVGLPQLSETVYTPSLPDIANGLSTTESMVESTLSIYLAAFAIGTLFWGRLSDTYGRKPCVIIGLLCFVFGCVWCYYSTTIYLLLAGRFVQAFGGSTGSVLGQAICRDAFDGPELGKVFALLGSALAIFPAVGPIIGGFIAEQYGWQAIFLFLIAVASILICLIFVLLPETLKKQNQIIPSTKAIWYLLSKDWHVLGLGFIVAACNGIMFSYFAEGPFYLISLLQLRPTYYGLTFILVAAGTLAGGITSRYLHRFFNGTRIMQYGLYIICFSSFLFSCFVSTAFLGLALSNKVLIFVTILSQLMVSFGICMATTNALATALIEYKWCIGTASALFGFFYYCLISAFTFGMAWLHNGTLYPMPFYFFGLGLAMILVARSIVKTT
ncbi:Bcr/CflA family efflux MFS transporter [Candidatus Dependentiae bacterium]|nr:MAG: Bcr/CflA family efflux MFS transporter [Candidatus Dependentiae bacterium]